MSIEAIVVKANPVTAWEQFETTLSPPDFQGSQPYEQRRRAVGGYYRATFRLKWEWDRLAEWFGSALGRHVEVFDHRGIQTWEGFIFEMTFHAGLASLKVSLGTMANRVWARYKSGSVLRSTVYSDSASQGRYGIREQVLGGGEVSSTIAAQIARTYLDRVKDPMRPAPAIRTGSGQARPPELEIRLRGYWDTLFWRVYNQTASSGTANASTVVEAVIDAKGQFVGSKSIEQNSSQVPQKLDSDRWAGDVIASICKVGDAADNPWVAGFGNNRRFYYRMGSRG